MACEDSPTPRSQDGTLDVGIAPALRTAVATRAVSTDNSNTAASYDVAVRGSDMAAREMFTTPCPHDGTLDFGISPALPAAVPTRAVSAE